MINKAAQAGSALSLSGALDGLASPGHLFLQRADSSGETVGVGGGPWCSSTPPPHSQPGLSLSHNQAGTACVRLIKASRVLIKLAVQPPTHPPKPHGRQPPHCTGYWAIRAYQPVPSTTSYWAIGANQQSVFTQLLGQPSHKTSLTPLSLLYLPR